MGTQKRERQKANRQQRLEELARQSRSAKRKRTGMYVLIIPLLGVLISGLVWLVNRGDDDATGATTTTIDAFASTTLGATTTTTPLPSTIAASTITGDTPCPEADGSSERVTTFEKAPPTCIDATKTYTATVTTNMGAYTVALDAKAAPITVNNFVVLARYHFFDSTVCHRAIPGFMVQCGDPTATGVGGPGYTITDELPADGSYKIGSLAMANTGSANTGSSQFFLITGQEGVSLPSTYSLFGQVTDGLDTSVKTLDAAGNPDPSANGVPPAQQIVIETITITES
ncbi:MAG TPA: peptidylprolyl isomerase [Ilumatobacteraceae bacterium]